ncbi:glycerophosphodiester phosphodiesterase [Streptosporangium jomthongense]|uniref:Glycerophosphodiester phosphodiesterase n=1 Tax=Streptosporangium jomthongense TaxID=1193683 RepID=A0ABV8F032_9ACTN
MSSGNPAAVRLARGTLVLAALAVVTLGRGGERTASLPPVPAGCPAPAVVSHRGYGPPGTENTLRAFRDALAAGSGQVELDVHFTRDHQPVLMHDATVDRTTTGTGRVSGMTLSRFRALRTLGGERPATLDEALRLLRAAGGRTLLDLKEVPDAADLRSLSGEYHRLNAYRWASLMSFSPDTLRAVRSIHARRGLLARTAPPVSLARRFAFVGIRHDRLTGKLARAYARAGVAVYAWTPNDPAAWRRMAGYGVEHVVTDETPAYLAWAVRRCGTGPVRRQRLAARRTTNFGSLATTSQLPKSLRSFTW